MKNIKFVLPDAVCDVLACLHAAGFEAYIVGGSVRDAVMGVVPHDFDITTSALPQETVQIFTEKGYKVIETGLKHGTVTVLCESQEFDVNCAATNPSTSLYLAFKKSEVDEQCSAHCSLNKFKLQGSLNFHISMPYGSMFEENTHNVPLHHQWITDFSVPDFKPLLKTIKSHWKLGIAALTSVALLTAMTYLFGPIILIYMVKFIIFLMKICSKIVTIPFQRMLSAQSETK